MPWKETLSDWSCSIFSGIKIRRNEEVYENEVKSNLPLQMAAYFNVVFAPVWITMLLIFVGEHYNEFGKLTLTILITILSTIFPVEFMRLYMVYEGNLSDKIPELAGFWMLSVFLQFPLQAVLLFNPYFQLNVLQIICQSVIFILLVLQIVFGYLAMRYTATQQALYYKRKKSNSNSVTKKDPEAEVNAEEQRNS